MNVVSLRKSSSFVISASQLVSFLIAYLSLFLLLFAQKINCHADHVPKLLLISLDGFRWNYLNEFSFKNIEYLKETGTHVDYVKNVFPTVTFVNHWSMVTGLYAESHGILHNNMYDRHLNAEFHQWISNASELNRWFRQNPQVEPIWITNARAGAYHRSAVQWIGGDVEFENVTRGDNLVTIPFNMSASFNSLIDQFVGLFSDKQKPINFGALYFHEPDTQGHLVGPESAKMKETFQMLDDSIGYLVQQLKEKNLFTKLNLIITSDHGMTQINNLTIVYLSDYVNVTDFKAYGSNALYSLFFPESHSDRIDSVYQRLKSVPNLDVYKRSEIPDEFHFKNNNRAGDLLVAAKMNHTVLISRNNSKIDWNTYHGIHGYNNLETLMHPLFVAHGPAFQKSSNLKYFNMVDLYPMMCFILNLTPASNNGSVSNVAEILFHYADPKRIFYIILSIGPVILALAMGVCLCILNKKYVNDKTSLEGNNADGYAVLAMNDALDLETAADDDEDDDDENVLLEV